LFFELPRPLGRGMEGTNIQTLVKIQKPFWLKPFSFGFRYHDLKVVAIHNYF